MMEGGGGEYYENGVKLISRRSHHGAVFACPISEVKNRSSSAFLDLATEKLISCPDDIGAIMLDFYDCNDSIQDQFIMNAIDCIKSILDESRLEKSKKSEEQFEESVNCFKTKEMKKSFETEFNKQYGKCVDRKGVEEVPEKQYDNLAKRRKVKINLHEQARTLADKIYDENPYFQYYQSMKSSLYLHLKMYQSCALHLNLQKQCDYLHTFELSRVTMSGEKDSTVNSFPELAKKQHEIIKEWGYDFSATCTIEDKIRLALKVIRDGRVNELSYFLRERGYFPENKQFGLGMTKWKTILKDLIVGSFLEGITEPYDYIGLLMSVFSMHCEDFMATNSSNFLWYGEPKVWIIVPPSEHGKLNEAYLNFFKKPCRAVNSCELQHKLAFLHPTLLDKWKIKYSIFVQEIGMMIITKTMAYHQGFNLGLNWARAVNLTLRDYGNAVITMDLKYQCRLKSCNKDVSGSFEKISVSLEMIIMQWYAFYKRKYFVPLYPINNEWYELSPAQELLQLFKTDVEKTGGSEIMATMIEEIRGKIDEKGNVLKAVESLLNMVEVSYAAESIPLMAFLPVKNTNQDLEFINRFQRKENDPEFVELDVISACPKLKDQPLAVKKMLKLLRNVKQDEHTHFSNWSLNQLAQFAMEKGMTFTVQSTLKKSSVTHGFTINPITNMPSLKCLCSENSFKCKKKNGTALLVHLKMTYERNNEKGLIL